MKSTNSVPILLLSALGAFFAPLSSSADASSHGWETTTPEEVGLDSAPLIEMFDHVRARKIPVHSIQIVRHGRLALDAYFFPYDGSTRHDVASVTKSVTSILIGLAIDRGHIRNANEPILPFFPAYKPSENKDVNPVRTIKDLLTMQSGWDCGFEPNEARLFEMRHSPNWVGFMFDLPTVAGPGTRWAYCSGNCHVLSALLTRATGTNALAFARRNLFEPLGISDAYWSSDADGSNHGWGDLQLHPLDMAKLGQLFLQRGRWGQRQILAESWVKLSTAPHVQKTSNRDRYGFYWWVKDESFPGMFEAVGRGGQRITVWPEKDLVVVFTGGGFEPGDLSGFLLKSLKSDKPLPASPEGNARLQAALTGALKSPAAHRMPPLPQTAARISGKKFSLESNPLDLSAITFEFSAGEETSVEFQRLGDTFSSPVGLDGVPRVSRTMLLNLPFTCQGQWLSDRVFLLELDRAAGISFYQFRITFPKDAQSLTIELKERTGLSAATFRGTAQDR